MAGSEIDYQAVFMALPGPILLLRPDGVILDANESITQTSGRPREQLLGHNVFDQFPSNPDDPGATGVAELRESLHLVRSTGERDVIGPIRYDVEDPGRPGEFEERYWAIVNSPVLDENGEVMMIVHRSDEVTHIITQLRGQSADHG
jgi:PAS domain S-box-containing protein